MLAVVILFSATIYYENASIRKSIFGVNYTVIKEIYADDTERDFHEDGFSISVDSISKIDAKYFSNPPKEFFNKYPKKSFHLSKYKIHTWKKTPFNINDTIEIDFATNLSTNDSDSYVFNSRTLVMQNLTRVSKLLNEQGSLYAFSFRNHPFKLYGVDLYVIDTKGRKIYMINRQ